MKKQSEIIRLDHLRVIGTGVDGGCKVTEKAVALDYWKSKHKQDEDDIRKLCELFIPEVTTDVE